MKRALVFCLVLSVLVISVGAAYIPESVIRENRDGRQLIIKTFTISPSDDPETLIEEPFEQEGFFYSQISITKAENYHEESKTQTESVTIDTSTNNLSVILDTLPPSREYNHDGYSGILTLDHTSLKTEAAGYSSKSSTISDTKTIEGLDRNDPSYVPKTTVKNGVTLNLANVEWSIAGTSLSDGELVPTLYTAVATYTAKSSYRVATGYVTTATYIGNVVSKGVESITYTVTYLGTPIKVEEPAPPPPEDPKPQYGIYFISGGALLLLSAGIVFILLFRYNTNIYTLSEDMIEYDIIGKARLSRKRMSIDCKRFKTYPRDEVVIEVKAKTARKLFGKLVRVSLKEGLRTHRIEQYGSDNYWFTVFLNNEEDIT